MSAQTNANTTMVRSYNSDCVQLKCYLLTNSLIVSLIDFITAWRWRSNNGYVFDNKFISAKGTRVTVITTTIN